ncbi:MAG TPA: RdgB/HAM1 family non-canonical purine NTP pyrophosphatase [Acidobacteriaceae bacterium]|nr:RdgB/HAM1 family non-canonical purine NTP pyrophosphatase [Acidobacteriaceae bacterium]
MTIYAATTNEGKLREFRECAGEQGVEVLVLPGIEGKPEPVEDAATFEGNAELKAVAYSKLAPGLMVFADDSGLEVDALGGQPGVRSARFADDLGFEMGQGSKDERNNRALLSLLRDLERELEPDGGVIASERGARFVCALVLARDGAAVLRARGEVEGVVLEEPRGTDGFGYDPLFLVPEMGKTLAELSKEEKWRVSHRGNAFRELLSQLKSVRAHS